MPSRHKFHLVKVEVEKDQMLEEDADTRVEDAALQAQVEGETIKSKSMPKPKSSTRSEV